MTGTQSRPAAKHTWKTEAAYDPEPPRGDTYDRAGVTAHIYDQHRCIFCNTNDLDDDIYGPFDCIEREPYAYTTETGDPPMLDLPFEAQHRAWFDELMRSMFAHPAHVGGGPVPSSSTKEAQ